MLISSIFEHKIFICQRIFKIFAAHFTTNLGLHIGKKIFFLPQNIKILPKNSFSEVCYNPVETSSISQCLLFRLEVDGYFQYKTTGINNG